jgi:CheB methylesterase/Low molecular weight phosphotyrosine protein phosphatase
MQVALNHFPSFLRAFRPRPAWHMCFVQHLDPAHDSRLVEILSKRQEFPVEQAREGTKILPDRLFVIPPNTTLTMGGVLHLRSRDPSEKPHRPVDVFLHSLAQHRAPYAVMNELGIDISDHRSKHVDEFLDQSFDYVLTVCDSAKESCPVFPNQSKRIHMGFEDPATLQGTEQERLALFRRVRDEIRDYLKTFPS